MVYWCTIQWDHNYLYLEHALFKYTGVEIHSFGSHSRDHFVLEGKSMLKIEESTLNRVIQITSLEWIPPQNKVSPNNDYSALSSAY